MIEPPRFNILVITDERPGHENQSDGVVMAVKRTIKCSVTVERLVLPDLRRQRIARHILVKTRSIRLAAVLMNFGSFAISNQPDLIVSTGGDTLAANAVLAKHTERPNIAVGSLRGLSPHLFQMILHIDPRLADKPNHWIGLKPAAIDPSASGGVAYAPKTFGLVLLGGPTASEPLALRSIKRLLAKTVQWRSQNSIQGVVMVGSRRTPESWERAAQELANANRENTVYYSAARTSFSDVRTLLLNADAAFVTADSSSMITEAVYAKKPVIAISSNLYRRTDGDAVYIRNLQSQGCVAVGDPDDPGFNAHALAWLIESCAPVRQNPLTTLGQAIHARGII